MKNGIHIKCGGVKLCFKYKQNELNIWIMRSYSLCEMKLSAQRSPVTLNVFIQFVKVITRFTCDPLFNLLEVIQWLYFELQCFINALRVGKHILSSELIKFCWPGKDSNEWLNFCTQWIHKNITQWCTVVFIYWVWLPKSLASRAYFFAAVFITARWYLLHVKKWVFIMNWYDTTRSKILVSFQVRYVTW